MVMGRNHSLHRSLRWSLSKFPYLSGLNEVSQTQIIDEFESTFNYATQFYPAWEIPGGRESQWYQYNSGIEDFAWPITESRKEFQTDDDRFLTDWVKNVSPLIDPGFAGGLLSFPNWPGMYTGKMRFVAQKELGYRGKLLISIFTGLWTPESSLPEHERQRWCIEITSQGVTAYPIFFNKEVGSAIPSGESSHLYRYDFGLPKNFLIPSQATKNASLCFGDEVGEKWRYELLSSSDMDDVYIYNRNGIPTRKGYATPWYSNWAFSYSGKEAQIVLFELREYNSGEVYYSKRYKIEFTQGSLNIDGKIIPYPRTANISVVDEGFIWTSYDHDLQFFAPLILPSQERIAFETTTTPPPTRDAPVYVFYTRDNNEVVLKRKDEILTNQTLYEKVGLECSSPAGLGCIIPCVYCNLDSECNVRPDNGSCISADCQRQVITAEKCEQGFEEYKSEWTSNFQSYYCDRTLPAGGLEVGLKYGTYRYVDWTETPEEMNGVICNLLNYDFVVATERKKSIGYETRNAPHYEEISSNIRIILPLYDREGFYHFKNDTTTYTSSFSVRKSEDHNISRISKIKGPYECMPEISVNAEYASTGQMNLVSSEVTQPEDETNQRYVYIGSVAPDENGASDSVIELEEVIQDQWSVWPFGDGMVAIAAVEMFSGNWILSPHPPVKQDLENRNVIFSDENYPVMDAYRVQNDSPFYTYYFTFVGDGITTRKKKMTADMNAIPYLRGD